jgi:hypothetical protein
LPAECVDLVFVCDTYHHFEFPFRTLASIHKALKKDGQLIVIDFHRIKGTSREWTMGHVRAGQEVFEKEIIQSGFVKVSEEKKLGLKENYFVRFKKVAKKDKPNKSIEFNRDVRPILAENCFACHGFDAKARKAKLRLDVPEGAFAERRGLVPIKPGDLKSSEVWFRIMSGDPEAMMPPPDSRKKLTAAQKETLKRWIEQGAKYQKHWSFEPIVSREPKAGAKSIDAFLDARLKKEGLVPTKEADRETLIRRVSFAFTGL